MAVIGIKGIWENVNDLRLMRAEIGESSATDFTL
jgi:hypothetical protein